MKKKKEILKRMTFVFVVLFLIILLLCCVSYFIIGKTKIFSQLENNIGEIFGKVEEQSIVLGPVEIMQDGNFSLILVTDTHISGHYPTGYILNINWTVKHFLDENIKHVAHLGDIVSGGDNRTYWDFANETFSILEKNNIPYSVLPGNGDQNTPLSVKNFTTYSQYFPIERFSDKPWWGGSEDSTNAYNYVLFSAEGNDYIGVSLGVGANLTNRQWANETLHKYAGRRAIIFTHNYLYGDGTRTQAGEDIWKDIVVPNKNVFMVVCGHMSREALRVDVVDGRTIFQMLANYQSDGALTGALFIRKLTFTPENKVFVSTLAPYITEAACNQKVKNGGNLTYRIDACYENDSNSEFVLDLSQTCFPSCADNCGQDDGCGGICPSNDIGTCGKCGNAACEIYVDSGVASSGDGSAGAPFKTIQEGINVAYPGARVIVKDGIYSESISTQRAGTAEKRIVLRTENSRKAIINKNARILYINHPYITVEGFVFNESFGTSRPVEIDKGDFAVLRDIEIENALINCIDMTYSLDRHDILIEDSEIHHCLAGNYTYQADAHGITGSRVKNLTIRNTEIYYVSGDAVQFDPDRMASAWEVNIEDSNFWTGPLPFSVPNFIAGSVPGENAFDSKHNYLVGLEKSKVVIKNSTFHGWRNNPLINNSAALNIKENVSAIVDGNIFYNNEIALRLRGPAGGRGGANVTMTNNVIYDNNKSVRYEDGIENLHIYYNTFGADNLMFFDNAGGYGAGFEVLNNLFLGMKPGEASDSSNLDASASDFADLGGNDYHLSSNSAAIDAGVAIAGIIKDKDGISRPQGARYDAGAYEYVTLGLPTAPTGLTATLANGIVILNWIDNSDDETGFIIERSSDGGISWEEKGRVGANVTSWEDTDVQPSPEIGGNIFSRILDGLGEIVRNITGYIVKQF